MNGPLKPLLQKTFTTPTIRSGLVMMKKMLMIQQKIDWKFDSPIFLACITAKAMFTYWW